MSVETLMHYRELPVTFDRTRTYKQEGPYSYGKPVGFWVSVQGEDDWPSWCRGEEYCLDDLLVPHEVTLADGANILRLETTDEMREFTNQFIAGGRHPGIDWRRVSELYDGILIPTYQWSLRCELDWYYGWDCASGCIWNLHAIASVDLVSESAVAS